MRVAFPQLSGDISVSKRLITIGVVLVLLAMVPFVAWPVYKTFFPQPVSTALFNRTKAAVEKNPQLQSEWNAALQDGVLTWPEASAILQKAGEKADPE
jgi:hypothetical protein